MSRLLLFAVALLAACSSAYATLTPAPSAVLVDGTLNVAIAERDGVRLTVQADAWDGDRQVADAVQTVRVTIANHSDHSLRVRYEDFSLVASTGQRFAALPPFKVEGSLMQPMLADGYAPFGVAGFGYRGFLIAPYYARLYPGIPVFPSSRLFYEPGFYTTYHRSLTRSIRPTVQMLSLAMPEGVIEAGGQLSGFLYFEAVDARLDAVQFQADLSAVQSISTGVTEQRLGLFAVPLLVSRQVR